MGIARCRFASLWLSQVARILADNCLRVFILLALVSPAAAGAQRASAWHLLSGVLLLPAVFLAPLNGAIGNSLPKRFVLAGTALYCGAVTAAFGLFGGPWVACWALVAVGAAIYSPTRYALLPAAAEDSGIPLTRVNGLIEMGAVTAIVAGWALGGQLYGARWGDLEVGVALAAALNVFAVLTALPVHFRADVRRPESPGQAVAGFFRDTRRVLRDPEARGSLLALASLRGVVLATMGALIAATLTTQQFTVSELIWIGLWVSVGVAAGSLLAGVQRHPRRALGVVPIGCTGLLLGLILAAAGGVPGPALCVILGAMGGLVNVPLAATYQAAVPADARGNGMAVRNLVDYLFMAAAALLMYGLAESGAVSPSGQFWVVAGLAAVATVVAWRVLFSPFMELFMELVMWPLYKVRGQGPGLDHFPARGPLLVIANHSAWFDPLWLGKVLPRRVIPMMTSVFYDMPGLRWLMKHVVHAIRVQASTYRREAPELLKAIRALDQGECVVLFPEGAMRRTEEKPLRQFGQGVWHILKERPQTPIIICWIEGGWGCFFSYYKGLPTKNKRLDFWRPITIAVGPVQQIDPALLEDHRATRAHLMKVCLETRRYLGLEALSGEQIESEAEKEPDKTV